MASTYTTNLGLTLPTTGELAGTWGSTVNTGVTTLIDSAIAGTETLTTDADVTLTNTTGAANQARMAILNCTGARTLLRNITAPAATKEYTIINATTGGFSVVVRGVGPTTGVTVLNGQKVHVAWNGTDFVKVSSSTIAMASEVTGTLPVANGGTGTTTAQLAINALVGSVTDGYVVQGNGTNIVLGVPPAIVDTNPIVKGSVDATKQMRFEVDGLTTGTTRVITVPNADITIAAAGANSDITSLSAIGAGTALLPSYSFASDPNTGAWSPAADTWAVSTGGSDRMRIDTVGNLGIGVTPIAGYLNTTAYKYLWLGASNIAFGTNTAASAALVINANAYIDAAGVERYNYSAQASRYTQVAGTHNWSVAPSGTAGNPISFTQAMTLDASGHLLLGTTSNTSGCMSVIKSNVSGQVMELQNFSDVGYGLYFKNAAGAAAGSVSWTATTTTYATSSDARMKENIVDAASADTLIDSLQVRQYDWKSDGSHQRYGFVAQELVTVYPEAVKQSEDHDEMMAVDYSKLVPLLVKEIQSLRARVAQLESK